ncbi:TPA: DUF4064 domain-containing protein [Enterococcus faecium]|uniref:DUF4064 domain-containing protein n=1 Tax=Enterococcus faecium TaxID=1352 RepID=UPI0022515DEE|nr:DUF4064 domain-containing protein [Enterococcus faecium]MCX4088087.1 DUF4064 domain-containing protein [Enterococcus faecium]HAZ0792190.1 DUF4064 domain-containing protein [Enterococcus faecium]HAZ0894171.1 DUF4064 domain-containing protein [Enterococcus faecium]HAZ0919462.1 DUF4064 domain-containing protein [Enterococcus faecium]HAZ0967070.1 DUF4064 domain-containing protein [Enterococcus faecium]
MNKRKTEFILILISGITGILCSLLALMGGMFLSSIDSTTLNTTELTSKDIDMLVNLSGNVVLFGGITLVFSIMIFIIGFLVRKNQKTVVYGISLLILSIIPFFLLTLLWVIPGDLGIIAGLMLLIRKS